MTAIKPSLAETIDRVRKSGLVPSDELNAFLADSASSPIDEDGHGFCERLVHALLLTPFQAQRILAGKYKGFFLGGYVILDQLGSGGMGQVFLAEHTTMRRLVAIKVLPLPVMDDTVARERFIREARAAAALNHPNIVKVYDLNREGKLLYLVMEMVEGVTLQDWVAKKGRLPVETAVAATAQIAMALQHAHDCSLVHRDVKPGNIILDKSGTARLLDLGLARSDRESDSKLTGKIGSSILGTADYLAPEQALDSHTVDIRGDIYSLAATLYFLLAGRVLFPEGRTAQKLMWQQWREPTPLQELNPAVPAGLAAVVAQGLRKKPEERYQVPKDFAEALLAFAGSEPPAPPPELIYTPPKRRGVVRAPEPSPNGTLSAFKLEFSSTHSALHGLPASKSRESLDSPSRVQGSPSSSGANPSGSSLNDTKPLKNQQSTPTVIAPATREPLRESVETAAPPTNSGLKPVLWASVGLVVGLAIAGGLLLLLK